MDVEKIQKINDLALKLQQQGNMPREEAVRQAEQMLSKNSNLEINEISDEKMKEIDTQEKPDEKQKDGEITWQQAMKKNTDYIVRQFKDIQKEIVSMKAEMENLHHEIKNLKTAPPAPPPKPAEPKTDSQKELPKEKEKAQEKDQDNPRQGECKPEDYSVEKYFYCGNK